MLSPQFVNALCHAARNPTEITPGKPDLLEQLILEAADATFNAPDTPAKTNQWYTTYGLEAYCKATEEYPAGNFIRQVIYSNYRAFANLIGPKNRLTLDLRAKDPHDMLSIIEFVNQYRIQLEAHHHDRRFEFQQDERWQNTMFFYFLFSEYSINYGPQLKE